MLQKSLTTTCGKKIDDDAVFCQYCGKNLTHGSGFNEPGSDSTVNFTMVSDPQPQESKQAKTESKAGPSANSDQQTGSGSQGQYTLKIVRESQAFAVNPAVKIKIDGEREFSLDNDSALEIPIDGGEHIIYFSSGPRNKTVKRNITGDTVLSMKWNRITGAMEIV